MALTAEQQEFINSASKTDVLTTLVGAGKGLVKIKMADLDVGKTRLHKIPVSDLDRGLYETSAALAGNYRTSWIMKLKREPGKCKLPRGFGRLSGKNI